MHIITKEWLLSNKTPRGSWNKKQLKCIGIEWPPKKGWQSKVVGKSISDLKCREFETGKTLNNRSRFDLDWCISQIITNYSDLKDHQKYTLKKGISFQDELTED